MAKQDVIALLEKDHREVERLFAKMEKAEQPEKRLELLETLTEELEAHAGAEEMAVYPRAVTVCKTEEQTEHSFEEHNEMRKRLAELRETEPVAPEWTEKLEELKETVEHHVEEEESQLFPKMRETFSAEALETMARDVEQAKGKLAKAS